MSEHCSRQERRSMEAEREMIALHMTLFMQDKLGETYEGVISHVTKFGFFVELIDYFVEGLVPLESLKGDIYAFDQEHLALKGKRHKKLFKIGDRVRITVEEVKGSQNQRETVSEELLDKENRDKPKNIPGNCLLINDHKHNKDARSEEKIDYFGKTCANNKDLSREVNLGQKRGVAHQ